MSFQGVYYQWVPYKKAEEKCVLNCMPVGERFYYRHQDQVIDGTPCSDEGRDVCVNGKCMSVGCDNLLGSKMREDVCRVCGGDGSTCTTKSGVIEKNALFIGYEDLFIIPTGATNIRVREKSPSNNYLAVRNKNGHFYLNGNWKIDYSQSLKFAGTIFVYERKSFPFLASESISALGPTNEALYIVMLYQEPNPGIEYTYSVPKGSFLETPNEGYVWAYDSFSECNVTCGQGYQFRRVWCSQGRNEVSLDLCDSGSEPTSINICSKPVCPAKWYTSDWSRCSEPCGKKGTRSRQVICQQEVGLGAIRVDESLCLLTESEPPTVEECEETGPCPTWHEGPWKPCDHLCGKGKQRREVHCYKKTNGLIEVLDKEYCAEKMPETEKSCNLRPCEGLDWITSDWSGCSEKCGVTFETRTAQCANEKGVVFPDSMCQENLKPELKRNCVVSPCASQWFASQWSPCSAKCGVGIQSRDVFCVSFESDTLVKVDESKCDPKLKYDNQKECKVEEECKGEWFAGPFGECSKPCGGGLKERKVMCLKNSTTVNLAECDESKIILKVEDCNKEPCGEDHIIPVSTDQTILEEDSEECDYDDYDYEDTTSSEIDILKEVSFGSEGDDGSGDLPSEPDLNVYMTTTGDILLRDEPQKEAIGSSETTQTSDSLTTSSLSMSMVTSDSTSSDLQSSSTLSGSSMDGSSSSMDGTSLSSSYSSSEATSDFTQSSTDSSTGSSTDLSTDSSTDLSTDLSTDSSTDLSTDSSTGSSVDSSSVSSLTSDSSSASETLTTTSDSSTTESSVFSSFSTFSTLSFFTSVSTDESTSSPSEGSSLTTGTGFSDVTSSESSESSETVDLTTFDETSSSEPSSIFVDTSSTPSESSTPTDTTDESSATSEWTPVVYDLTTESPIDAAITKEQKVRKCKKRRERSKCAKSKFGCCPDKKTKAKGPFGKGCSVPKTCKEAEFGCCLDGLSSAKGPKYKGCPKPDCDQTLFGCCKDGVTASKGNYYEGCPEEPTTMVDCMMSKWGCCPDGILSAMGPNQAGCVCDNCVPCNEAEYGCCPDRVTTATGPNYEGCNILERPDCKSTEHGCCPNGLTAAEGPENKGCASCQETEFGCCPDGVKSALGDNSFGCEPVCASSQFGCCPDQVTMAHGPHYEGCCLAYQFGCCPDHITPARGPNNEGCECTHSPYGCCPDNTTAAKGYNKEGCGCQHSEHGCCPDDMTAAQGPEFEGCPCSTFQFGCCPDGVTRIQSPYDVNCRCETTPYGCCSDGVTTKLHPDEKCSCEATKYGCCHDGYTEAQGDNFEGCENVPPKGEICSLQRDAGPCRDFATFYFFDMQYGGCAKFWYGGCEGNLNRFKTQEECHSRCVVLPGKDACTLPKSVGACSGQHSTLAWYFDNESKRCQEFYHSGCLGNNNRFDTREQCEELCGSQDHLDECEQSLEPGPCHGQFRRWYFNKQDKTCQEFVYGGCKGTKNNFMTEAACKYRCMRPPTTAPQECFAPKQTGNCTDKIPKWYFAMPQQKCMPFYYTGCNGNGNSFNSQEECETNCPIPKETNICTLPAVGGGCSNYTSRYYYDTAKKSCEHFYYGGCEGNENNFLTQNDCMRRCGQGSYVETPEEPFSTDMCVLPQERGRCNEYYHRYSYNHADGTCKPFTYTGCEGNGNNFETEEQCQQSCGHTQDKCSLPRVAGPCDNWTPQYYYDPSSDRCLSFNYGGCLGNSNRFNTIEECEHACKRSEEPPPEPPRPSPDHRTYSNICLSPVDPGPCLEQIPSWHYDSQTGECKSFLYGGCEGNANRFLSEEQCERQCGEYRSQDACSGYSVSGTCHDSQLKYFFDSERATCSPFTYSGCGGTANRFSSVAECESMCRAYIEPKPYKGRHSETATTDICTQPMEPGNCDTHLTRWIYDDEERTCISFLYTGCGGNFNNFETNEECMNFCVSNDIDVGPDVPTKDCRAVEDDCRRMTHCQYGIERWVDDNDCENCRCNNPCEPSPCSPHASCEVERTEGNEFKAVCTGDEHQHHPGVCPHLGPEHQDCNNECEYDSDCKIYEKCCYNGCGLTCIPAVSEVVTQAPNTYAYILDDTPSEAEEEEGNMVSFECNAHGSPAPKVEWKRNGQTITASESSKYRVAKDGKLEIIGLEIEDDGEYVCEASNGGVPATRLYHLTVREGTTRQVTVVNNPDEKEIIATINNPVVLRCYAIGFPAPSVSWWKGEKVLLRSDGIEQRRDNSLYIQRVSPKHLGYYTCQLYNGGGSAASFTLTLKMYGPIDPYDPNDLTSNQFLVPSPKGPPVEDRPRPPPYHPQVPVQVHASSTAHKITQGSNVTLNCSSSAGNPVPEYTWLKDSIPLYSDDRVFVQNNWVIITNAQPSDSGEYTCVGDNRHSSAQSSVAIEIESAIPANCTDSPYFANCELIVGANYCNHEYYAKFCCKSCTEAGKFSGLHHRRTRSIVDFIQMQRIKNMLPSRTIKDLKNRQ
ncbi:papilin isoform X1 [Cimex lectularius]|uniref:Papilin n=1 Tax=Cimex lectularius TaxID=79782 RepID=A0A8I6SK13_CIMLE|nr:papilin isoform X1 [Cimex lectularius]